ncbi:MAG: hypothetical protein ACTS42_00585 [Candidatus Hodgkinia cicadicola]
MIQINKLNVVTNVNINEGTCERNANQSKDSEVVWRTEVGWH